MGLLTQPNEYQMLETNTIKTLKEIAKSNGIKGYSKLKRSKLLILFYRAFQRGYLSNA